MNEQNTHASRFESLMAIAEKHAPARRTDCGYLAALYVLSADDKLYHLARTKIDDEGIHFSALLKAARRSQLSDVQITAARAANSLFNDGCASVTPSDLARCDYDTLDIIANALYIRKGGRVPVPGSCGRIILDNAAEQRSRAFSASMDSLFTA